MISFKSEDHFYIRGCGNVFTLHIPEDLGHLEPSQVIKNNILVDGFEYYCTGIEHYGIPDWNAPKSPIGLMVRGDLHEQHRNEIEKRKKHT